MNELIQSLQQKIGFQGDQVSNADTHMMDYIKSKLPESLNEHLDSAASGTDLVVVIESKAEGLLSSLKGKLNM